jgi:hypothetical protein
MNRSWSMCRICGAGPAGHHRARCNEIEAERCIPCDRQCPGWGVENPDGGPNIQRCDSCARFVDDDAAREHVRRLWRQTFALPVPSLSAENTEMTLTWSCVDLLYRFDVYGL